MEYISFLPGELNKKDLHQFILGAINPRPIAYVSTVDSRGRQNLAPFSFFNAISSNPPIVVFSVNRRAGEHPEKDTLINLKQTSECVINVVTYDIWRQAAISSVEFPHGVSEFNKSGLESINADMVRPGRVKESPVQMECTVRDIIAMGDHPGAANLVICDVIKMHIKKKVMDNELRRIDPQRMDIMGRLGRSHYVRVNGESIMTCYQPVRPVCLGFDALPESIQRSRFFTGNDLAKFASLFTLPDREEVAQFARKAKIKKGKDEEYYHRQSKILLDDDKREDAIKMAMIGTLSH